MLKLFFRVYTKTFGGKIWTNLHRVSPGNFLGKTFNEASFKNSHKQTIIQQHLVQKELKSSRQFLFCSSKKVSKQSEMFRLFEGKFQLDMFIFTPFFFTSILCTRWYMEVANEKASWQTTELLIRNINLSLKLWSIFIIKSFAFLNPIILFFVSLWLAMMSFSE